MLNEETEESEEDEGGNERDFQSSSESLQSKISSVDNTILFMDRSQITMSAMKGKQQTNEGQISLINPKSTENIRKGNHVNELKSEKQDEKDDTRFLNPINET